MWGSSVEGTKDGSPTVATFSNPVNMVADSSGVLYVADYDSSEIRRIDLKGNVTTMPTITNFTDPFGMGLSSDGHLLVGTDADSNGNKNASSGTIWSIDTTTGKATVVISNLGRPRGLRLLADGRIAVSDLSNNTISLLNYQTGKLALLAGASGQAGFTNGTGKAALFSRPYGLTQLPNGDLLVADQNNNCVRRVTLAGVVTTFAGTGAAGSHGGAIATSTFNGPEDVASGPDGTVYVEDTDSHLIRKITNGFVDNEAGDGKAGFKDGTGTGAEFYGLEGMFLTPDGKILWIADGNGGNGTPFNRVRRLKVP